MTMITTPNLLIELKPEDVINHPFITKDGKAAFYRFIGEKFAPYEKITSIDCRKINVARNIQDTWYKYAEENGMDKADLTMILLMNGPKTDEYLNDNQVGFNEGAIKFEG